MTKRFILPTLIGFAFLVFAIAGCGGGGNKCNVLGITISGTALAPRVSVVTSGTPRAAAVVQGLQPVDSGTPVAVYYIDNSGAFAGSPLATGYIAANGSYNLVLPPSVTGITSNMVVVVGGYTNQLRAFVSSTSGLTVDPASEYVVTVLTSKCSSLLATYTLAELAMITNSYRSAIDSLNYDYGSSGSVSAAITDFLSNSELKNTVSNVIVFAGGNCSGWTGLDNTAEDAFGNIMETSFPAISNVTFSASPSAGTPVVVTAAIAPLDEGADSPAPIASASIFFSVNGGAQTESVMTDNGNGTWSGAIPGRSSGDRVSFYIKAKDTFNNTTSGAISSSSNLVSGVADIDNGANIISDNSDMLNLSANYDADYLYVSFDVQGVIDGGTTSPPYALMYAVKITNPDTEQGEGLMVGDLWLYIPLIQQDPQFAGTFLPALFGQDYTQNFSQSDIDKINSTGMVVLNIQNLMGGDVTNGYLATADPSATLTGNRFYGRIKRSALGANPSNSLRLTALSIANASLDSFMPIPLNCANFLTLNMSNYSYTVQ
jgi:hypothetical protein